MRNREDGFENIILQKNILFTDIIGMGVNEDTMTQKIKK